MTELTRGTPDNPFVLETPVRLRARLRQQCLDKGASLFSTDSETAKKLFRAFSLHAPPNDDGAVKFTLCRKGIIVHRPNDTHCTVTRIGFDHNGPRIDTTVELIEDLLK